MGELLGISHVIYFRLIDEDIVYLRLVNLETAEIEVNAFVKAKRELVKNQVIIRSIVKGLVASNKMTISPKDLLIKYSSKSEALSTIIYQDSKAVVYQNK